MGLTRKDYGTLHSKLLRQISRHLKLTEKYVVKYRLSKKGNFESICVKVSDMYMINVSQISENIRMVLQMISELTTSVTWLKCKFSDPIHFLQYKKD